MNKNKGLKTLYAGIIIYLILCITIISVYNYMILDVPYCISNTERLNNPNEYYGYLMHDDCNIIFSADKHIKEASEYLYNNMGIQIYYIAKYVPENCSTEEEFMEYINDYIDETFESEYNIYVCYSYYPEDDTRDDFFIYDRLVYGDEVAKIMNEDIEQMYNKFYANYRTTNSDEVWYTFSDCVALGLVDTFDRVLNSNKYIVHNFVNPSIIGLILITVVIMILTIVKKSDDVKSTSDEDMDIKLYSYDDIGDIEYEFEDSSNSEES